MEHRNRKNNRLPGYDYSQAGGYFVTICTEGRRNILSRVLSGSEFARAEVLLSEVGCIADMALKDVSIKTGIKLCDYVIMPNHIHMILQIDDNSCGVTVGQFVGAFKSLMLHHWREICNRRGARMGKVWQRNYYEHILRNEADYYEKLRYIDENPDNWSTDELYSDNGITPA